MLNNDSDDDIFSDSGSESGSENGSDSGSGNDSDGDGDGGGGGGGGGGGEQGGAMGAANDGDVGDGGGDSPEQTSNAQANPTARKSAELLHVGAPAPFSQAPTEKLEFLLYTSKLARKTSNQGSFFLLISFSFFSFSRTHKQTLFRCHPFAPSLLRHPPPLSPTPPPANTLKVH